MSRNYLVQYDSDASIDYLIEQAHKNEITLDARDVALENAAMASSGEVWSPQLPAYRAWEAKQDTGEGRNGHEGDLLLVGSLGMGISDEARQRIIAPAVMGLREEGALAQRADLAEQAGRVGQPEKITHNTLTSLQDNGQLSGALGVRRDERGYTLTKVDLRILAGHLEVRSNLVVVLPASIAGIPVVRVAAEAFSRRFVQGIGVRLLVVPSSVECIDAGAFSVLSATHVHLGSGVRLLGDQPSDMAGVSPRLAKREYSVDPRNQHYASKEGSLLSRDGAQLLFLPSPYARVVELPAQVVQVGAAAFATGTEPPAVVRCSGALAHVASKAWDDAVWICSPEAPVVNQLSRRGVRMAQGRVVEKEGCYYDLDGESAILVAGPPPPETPSKRFAAKAAQRAAAARGQHGQEVPAAVPAEVNADESAREVVGGISASTPASAADTLVLPPSIDGLPLARLGTRALPFAPATLIIPSTVKEILPHNAARGVKHLSLPQGLVTIGAHSFCSRILEGVVPIPASVTSIGEGCFEYAICRLEQVGVRVHLSADQLQSCFVEKEIGSPSSAAPKAAKQLGEGSRTNAPVSFSYEREKQLVRGGAVDLASAEAVPFDFARYDELLCSGKNLPDKMGAVLYRLAAPYLLLDKHRAALVAYLCGHEREALERVALEGDRSMVEALVDAGFINEGTFDRQIELLRAKNRTDCVIYLMEQQQKRRASEVTSGDNLASARNRFAL